LLKFTFACASNFNQRRAVANARNCFGPQLGGDATPDGDAGFHAPAPDTAVTHADAGCNVDGALAGLHSGDGVGADAGSNLGTQLAHAHARQDAGSVVDGKPHRRPGAFSGESR
jgi:hypothetical protein